MRLPATEVLRRRVERRESELEHAIGDLGAALQSAADWKRIIAEHPLESAIGVAALGFVVGSQPKSAGSQSGGLKALAGVGAESLLRAVASRLGV